MRLKKDTKAGFGIAGKVKIGERQQSSRGTEYPVSRGYFIPDAKPRFVEKFHKHLGEKPTELTVVFTENTDEVCDHYLELRDSEGRRFAYGDNSTFYIASEDGWTEWNEDKLTEAYGDIETFKKKAAQKANSQKGWQETLRLRFWIPELRGLAAEWQFTTKAKETSIPQIVSTFDGIRDSAGDIRMIPFTLTVEMVKSDRSKAKRRYPVVNMFADVSGESLNRLQDIKKRNFEVLNDAKIKKLSDKN